MEHWASSSSRRRQKPSGPNRQPFPTSAYRTLTSSFCRGRTLTSHLQLTELTRSSCRYPLRCGQHQPTAASDERGSLRRRGRGVDGGNARRLRAFQEDRRTSIRCPSTSATRRSLRSARRKRQITGKTAVVDAVWFGRAKRAKSGRHRRTGVVRQRSGNENVSTR